MKAGKPLNIILMGRKYWSSKALKFLLDRGHNVVAVVGRNPKEELDSGKGSLIKMAIKNNLLTPSPSELYSWFNHPFTSPIPIEEVDLIISYLFWRKVKEPLLSKPKLGAINFHPAPLPDYKGLGGYNAAILNGNSSYGVTAHFMNEKIDGGDIIKVNRFKIDKENETALSLERKSQAEMFNLFKETIELIEANKHRDNLIKQREAEGIYINRDKFEEMKHINLNETNEMIARKIRAFWYPPYEGAKIKVGERYYTLTDNKILESLTKLVHI
ncbi:methionyl-tRNA formyltransferase [Bacillus freudenreichii]|nr:methionyl-tRNA formyltransferase [Bacillus freudenreichii]